MKELKPIIEKLVTKQANLASGLEQSRLLVLKCEQQLQEARASVAACEGAKQQVDETLNALLQLRDAAQAAGPKA